jgi:dethiobiotin synthetase
MTAGVFISSTGTSAGKTFVARGLAAALREQGRRVGALKPLETGCQPEPLDALALATACGVPELAHEPGFYRAKAPVSPFAATLAGEQPVDFEALTTRIRSLGTRFERLIVEGAGGLLVPLDDRRDMSDFARALAFPLLIVAPNRLGVLSHVFALAEAARHRALSLAAIVLTEPDTAPDASSPTNAAVLRSRLSIPILAFPHCCDDDASLAAAARAAHLPDALAWAR